MREYNIRRWGCLGSILLVLLFWLMVALLLSGCSTGRTVERVVVKSDTCYMERVRKDSVLLHDSVFVTEYMRGDTVFRDRYKWQYVYKDRLLRDTSYVAVRDTVREVRTVEVEKKLSKWQRLRLHIADVLLVGIVVGLLLGVRKLGKLRS